MIVLKELEQEKIQIFTYPDEKIASNVYQTSLSYAFRALAGMDENEKLEKEKLNQWLEQETDKIHNIPVLDFDNITKKLSNGKKSCDAFFYNFSPNDQEQHYLVEMKNTNKKTMLSLLEDTGKDGIYNKVSDSVQTIKNQLEFGGAQEKADIVLHTHFLIVYSGKNNVPSRKPFGILKKRRVLCNDQGKQKKAGRKVVDSEKKEWEVYERFESKIQTLGLAACDENTFPGNALPRARKGIKGKSKQRAFSLLSAHDFATIIDSGFFTDWKWGKYKQYFDR